RPFRPERRYRPGGLPRRQGGGYAEGGREAAQGLSHPPRIFKRNVPHLCPSSRRRSFKKTRGCRGVLMNQITPPQKFEIIPSSAPFSEAQRSWLNGFFAGLVPTDGAVGLSSEQGAS